ncbi:hypothetical protein [Kribbella sp. NPDC048928]|uniref:hypothetical protein n=1 Tax=Kribbella sp. NPDC048928 TaxID=3364111 RepID=UPI00371C5C3B
MAPQRNHELPDGNHVIVIDTESASGHLSTMLQRFREGRTEPMVFSDTGEPEGVVISFAQWLEYQELVEDAAAAARVEETTRQRLEDTPPEAYVPRERSRLRVSGERQDSDG